MIVRVVDARAEACAGMLMAQIGLRVLARAVLAAERLAHGDVLHLRRDDALARVVHLRDVAARRRPGAARASGRETAGAGPWSRAGWRTRRDRR